MAAVYGLLDEIRKAHKWGRERFPDALIAGGAIRDLILDRRPRDIDIFTTFRIPFDELMFPDTPENYEGTGGRIVGVSKVFPDFMFPRQFIQLWNDPEAGVHEFCFGLSQAWFDGKEIHTTEAFDFDRYNFKCTVTHCTNHDEARHILNKYEQIRERYPNHKLVIPTDFQSFFEEL